MDECKNVPKRVFVARAVEKGPGSMEAELQLYIVGVLHFVALLAKTRLSLAQDGIFDHFQMTTLGS